MERFDLQGPLPAKASTTVLEASAGTGKTFALAGLVTRYVADGVATLDQMLLITFSRAASEELRDRVRRQITDAAAAFDDPSLVGDNQLVAQLLEGTDDERSARRRRLRDALAGFDAATIATTHQFCQLVLKSLGVAGDSDSRVTLVENLIDLVTEVVDDLYLAHFGQEREDPALTYSDALHLAQEVVGNPATELRPLDPPPDSRAAVCVGFANHVLAELETRKRRMGILGYDDLLTRLAKALDADESPARVRMQQRWPIVMVDEFQDTDPVQWQVIDRAFSGRSTVILIGDPKQAIYAFRGRGGTTERNRRLDSDTAAVQIMTVWASKGLQYPIVYLPFAFNRWVPEPTLILFHDDGTRCLHIGGKESPDYREVEKIGREESAGDVSRLTYVAMTRAQSQVVAWWAPANGEPNGGLSRLLRGRRPGEPVVPNRCVPSKINDDEALARFREWEALGGPVLEQSVLTSAPALPAPPARTGLGARHFHRSIDATWRRTSYSGLIRVVETPGVSSEPEVVALDDEVGDIPLLEPSAGPEVPSPMANLPKGAKFGTLVHAVLETADPFATDLAAELEAQIREHSVWWPIDVAPEDLAAALVPLHDTPLGALADDLTLRQIGLPDRLRELDFEFPLAGGDLGTTAPSIHLRDVGQLLADHVTEDDPMAPYADRLVSNPLGGQTLRGYLNGSIDAVLRIPIGDGHRYVVVDYKSNWLGDNEKPLMAGDYDRARLVEAMLHSDYPLQALLYSVVLHRFLRWRQPGYSPERHLGGVLYLFVRGMCGPDTPVADGHRAGVFDWQPPTALIVAMSDLLDAGTAAA